MCVYLYVQLFNAKIDVIPLVAMLTDLINVSAKCKLSVTLTNVSGLCNFRHIYEMWY